MSDDTQEEEAEVKPPQPTGPMRFGFGMPIERSTDFGTTTQRLVQRMRDERTGVVLVFVLAIASAVMFVVGPKILGEGTDVIVRGLRSEEGIDFGRLHRVLLLAVFLYVGSSALSYLMQYLLAGIVQRTMYRLRSDVEDKLHRLPLSYVDRNQRGDLLSRVTNDVDNVAQSLQQTLGQLLTSLLTMTGTLLMMLLISPVLSVVVLITIPMSILAMRVIAGKSRKRFMAQWMHTGVLNAQVEEAFTGHAIVKSFGRQREVEAKFRETNDKLYTASFGAQLITGIMQPTMMVIGNLNFVAIAVVGGLRISSGAMTIGEVQAFIQYSRQFTMPLMQVASMVSIFQSGIASAERIFELLDAEEQSAEPLPALAPPPVRGRVEFDRVSFSYSPDQPLITDLSLVAEPGRTVAIVGPTGAGKTTLVNLIMRFYELDAGRITIDGRDIASMSRRELRSNIGMVLQDTWLFSGTIRDNIAYGKLGASEEEIQAAARATYVDRFVHALPHGYDTRIDDEGTSVSAGEKQLITIARAFLADPAILILDEATSSVDTRTEVLIQHAMAALRSQRTSFVIAHRLSTIRDADTILVMDGGRIVEQGDHESLLAAGGAYAQLYMAQFAGAAAEVA
jgi:ATP-binding cassette, subfamily B, multidrug efflux pump